MQYDGDCANVGVPTNDRGIDRKNNIFSKISPVAGSISTIIRSYKSIVSKTIKTQFSNKNFAWQTRFYDHIIRDGKSFSRISQYIIENPERWALDRNNPKNLYM
jgi:REP element-mobilizing transposase RayT